MCLSVEALLSCGVRVSNPRRHSSSMSMALLNKRVLAVAPCEARLDHTKTLSAFSSFVPATLPHAGLNVIVITGTPSLAHLIGDPPIASFAFTRLGLIDVQVAYTSMCVV